MSDPAVLDAINQLRTQVGALTNALGRPGGFIAGDRLSTSFDRTSQSSNRMGQSFDGLGSRLVGTTDNLIEFAKATALGQAKASDFWGALSPILPFGRQIQSLTKYSEDLMVMYRGLTTSGATFGGDLYNMSLAASRSMMDINDFAGAMRETSQTFSGFAGGVDAGITQFVETQQKLLGPNSQFAKDLIGLGVTGKETGDILTATFNSQASMTKRQTMDSTKLAESVARTATELDLYAKLTGQSRDMLAQELKSKSLDQAWITFTENLTGPEQEAANLALVKAKAEGGKGLEDLVKTGIMTGGKVFTATTEAAQQAIVATQGYAETYARRMYDLIMTAGTRSAKDQTTQMEQLRQDYGQAVRQFNKTIGTTGAVLAAKGEGPVAAEAYGTANRTGGASAVERVAAADEAQKKQAAGQAAAQAEQERQMKIFGNQLLEISQDVLRPLDTSFRKLSTAAIESTSALIGDEGFKNRIDAISKKIDGYVRQLEGGIRSGKGIEAMNNIGADIQREFENLTTQFLAALRRQTAQQGTTPPGSSPTTAPGETPSIYQQFAREAWGLARDEMVRGAREAMGAVRDSFTTGISGMFNSVRETIGLPPGRARGGTAGPGSYLVGENGPEVVNLGSRGDVITNENLTALLQNTTNQNGLKESIETLNSISGQMLSTLRDISDINKKTLNATRNLTGDLFAA